MRADQALARLQLLQRPIRAALREALPLLDEQDASRFKALSLLRWQVLRLMGDYQRFKHAVILDPVIARGGERALLAGAVKRRCEALAQDLDEHVRRWALEAPLRDWPLYQANSLSLRQRIEAQLEDELASVRDLLADAGHP